jgi:hypothetical protein
MPKGIPKKKLMSTAVRTAGPSTAEMGMDAVMDEGTLHIFLRGYKYIYL